MVTKVIAPELVNNLSVKLRKPSGFYSLIMDETTDISTSKQCAFTIIFYDDEVCAVNTSFLDMKTTALGTAEDLFTCLWNTLAEKSIALNNVVGLASNITNSIVGANNSIFSRFKELNSKIVCIKCSCSIWFI